MSLSNLPPGCPSPSRTEISFSCINPMCDAAFDAIDVNAWRDMGACFVDNEDDCFCRDCSWQMVNEPSVGTTYEVDAVNDIAFVDVDGRDHSELLALIPAPILSAYAGRDSHEMLQVLRTNYNSKSE